MKITATINNRKDNLNVFEMHINGEWIYARILEMDEIESLELQLTNIVAQLYAYRKEHENVD